MEVVGSAILVVYERHYALIVPMIVLDTGNSIAYFCLPVLLLITHPHDVLRKDVCLAVNVPCFAGVWLLFLLPLEWFLVVRLHSTCSSPCLTSIGETSHCVYFTSYISYSDESVDKESVYFFKLG